MINVFICDDELQHRTRLEKGIGDYILMENLDMQLTLTVDNPSGLLEYVKDNNISQGLYFLDIHLNSYITGIELAAKIREHDKRGMVVFVTTDAHSVKLTYKYYVEAIGYVVKDNVNVMEAEIKECLYLAQARLVENKEKMFVFKVGDKVSSIAYDEILYFEKSASSKNKVIMVTKKGTSEFYMTIKEIASMYESFHRVGASYVFNLNNVEKLTTSEYKVTMVNGLECDIPRRHSASFVKAMESLGV